MYDLVTVCVMLAGGFVSIQLRMRKERLRAVAIFCVLCVVTGLVRALPSFFFLVALPLVLLQYGYHIVFAVVSIVPALVVIALRLVPPVGDMIWAFLTLVCAFHALMAADWSNVEAPGFTQRLLIVAVILGAIGVWALGKVLSACIATLVLAIGLWRFRLHSFFDRIGRQFTVATDVRLRALRKEL